MSFLIENTNVELWEKLVHDAKIKCATSIEQDVEYYLAHLLDRYTNQPDVTSRMFATAYLEAFQLAKQQRELALQMIGDECLLFAGLFPTAAKTKRVGIDYFVKLGRSAYQTISHKTNDLYATLASHFVLLSDLLQTLSNEPILLPLDAYERWEKTGSPRAYQMIILYTDGVPIKLG